MNDDVGATQAVAWLLLDRARVPALLEPRVIELGLVPLRSDEIDSLSVSGSGGSRTDEELLASLVALGLSASEIARRLHVSRRTAYRRIERLKNTNEKGIRP